MQVRTVLILDGILTLVLGPLFFFSGRNILQFLGSPAGDDALVLMRLYGGMLVMNGIFFLGSANTTDNAVRKSFLYGSLVVDGVSAAVLAYAAYTGVFNGWGYGGAAVFATVWLLFLFALLRLDELKVFTIISSEDDILTAVKKARAGKMQIRVRGSAHSVNKAIFTDRFKTWLRAKNEINLYMSDYDEIVSIDPKNRRVEVQAGCHLGADPFDPAQKATWERSLLCKLDTLGWALPDLGGITHQTVAGFLMTGSSGGSIKYSIDDAIYAFRFIDGNGEIQTASRDRNIDLFNAVGVSMGLFGIISTVTFQCVPKYDIVGQEATTYDTDGAIDLFGKGDKNRPSLQKFMTDTEYMRMMWWPQKGVRKAVVWQAKRMTKADYNKETNPPEGPAKSPFKPKPYLELGENTLLAEIGASLFYTLIGNLSKLGALGRFLNRHLSFILTKVLNLFVVNDTDAKPPGPQKFWDRYYNSLPMDNQMRDDLMPTEFTELWIPIEKTQQVMNALLQHYEKNGLSAAGTYACEIYAAKRSRFWLSPAYNQNVVRIDVFWFARNAGNPAKTFYPQFWKLLKPFGFRAHWGKFLPPADSDTGREYMRQQYPRWDDFIKLRRKHDPLGIFLTKYWRDYFA